MKGDAQPLIKYFDGSDKRFIIPLYQRNYDWKEDNCAQLFQDLIKLHESNRKSHFFGSIVSAQQSGSEDKLIIDGQQRITTISLLLIALVNAAKEQLIEVRDARLPEKIYKRYLVDEYQEDERKVKLKPIKKDREAFDALLYKSKDEYLRSSNVTRNYEFFFDKVTRLSLSLDELFESIKKLEVINIRLNEEDDAQLIFESLNSTGLDLSEADKIRNFLLMSLTSSEQESLYTHHWNPIEEATHYDPTPFVRDYLTMKQGKIERIDEIYFAFKRYAETQGNHRATLLMDMHHFANIYQQIHEASFGSPAVRQKLAQLRVLESKVAYPFFMALVDYALQNLMSAEEVYAVFDVVEAYWARRIICNLASNALNNVFATLHKDVLKLLREQDLQAAHYAEVLKFVLLKKQKSAAFPSDDEVRANFMTRQVYKIPSSARTFLLERLENRDSKEMHNVPKLLAEKKISIEHIMPQSLSHAWKAELGDDHQEIHNQYLHTLANLTLTGYNSNYSNQPFAKKRDMDKGFKDSAFRLNKSLSQLDHWTKKELMKRGEELLEVFFKLWPMPTSTYVPKTFDAVTVTLDEEDEVFTGQKLKAYELFGTRTAVKSWKDMLIQVCKYMFAERRSTIEWLCANNKYGFFSTPEKWRVELSENAFVWADNNTTTKLGILRHLFEECGISASELLFELHAQGKGEADELNMEEDFGYVEE